MAVVTPTPSASEITAKTVKIGVAHSRREARRNMRRIINGVIFHRREEIDVFEVLTLNAISPRGLARLPRERYRVSSETPTPDAIIVRSFNLNTREIPATVRAIGRAGTGVNNIPVAEMSLRGIPVFN